MIDDSVRETVNAVYLSDSRRVLATLIRLLGDFDAAEEAVHDAFRAALEQWPLEGVPANPYAWLVSTGRFKAIDAMRRRRRLAPLDEDASVRAGGAGRAGKAGGAGRGGTAGKAAVAPESVEWAETDDLGDDRLRLVFICCHPALAGDAQVALTLREVCGLTTEEIAQAFLIPPPTLAQRIVRAKARIRDLRLPYQMPERDELPERLDAVLHVIYLVFNEGYTASSGSTVTRADLTKEAIRLGRLLVELLPEAEAIGLLALMLLHESRRAARMSDAGDLVLLDDQDRTLWDRDQIAEGVGLVSRALESGQAGPYTIQAAIAAVHAEAPGADSTDWNEIVGLYDALARVAPSPVVDLNRAVAVAMRDGPAAGLSLVEAILARGDLADYRLAHTARAELCRRLGHITDARASFERALALARQQPERRFIEQRIAALPAPRHRAR